MHLHGKVIPNLIRDKLLWAGGDTERLAHTSDLPCLPYVFIPHLVICLHESYENWKKEEIGHLGLKKHDLDEAR